MEAVSKFTLPFKAAGIGFKVDTTRATTVRAGSSTTGKSAAFRLRIEVGPKDLEKNQVMLARRDNGAKDAGVTGWSRRRLCAMLDAIQKSLFERRVEFREKHTHRVDDYTKFDEMLDAEGGFLWSHWCGSDECEERVKTETKATIRCIPMNRDEGDRKVRRVRRGIGGPSDLRASLLARCPKRIGRRGYVTRFILPSSRLSITRCSLQPALRCTVGPVLRS